MDNIFNDLRNLLKQFGLKTEINFINIPYHINDIKKNYHQYNILLHCNNLFPTAFKTTYINTNIKANFINKIKLNRYNIPYKVDSTLKIKSYSISPVIFHLQFIGLIIQQIIDRNLAHETFNSFEDFYRKYQEEVDSINVYNIKEFTIGKFLTDELGEEYSSGQLIDFIDRYYDIYKHTHILAKHFRLLFLCFGQYIDDIGNDAFERYMKNRNSNLNWHTATISFLVSYYSFSPEFSQIICDYIFF